MQQAIDIKDGSENETHNNNKVTVSHKNSWNRLYFFVALTIVFLLPIDICIRGEETFSINICPILYRHHTTTAETRLITYGYKMNRDFVVYDSYSRVNRASYAIVLTYPSRDSR
jgi:hypothetical protein